MFTCLDSPIREARRILVLLVPSLYADFVFNYRREVLLARALATRGFHALRFHYAGTGNSGGNPDRMTFEDLVANTVDIAEDGLGAGDFDRIVMLGNRWGGLIAAAASETVKADLVLWEPVVRPSDFFREGVMAGMSRLAVGGAKTPPPLSLNDQLEADMAVDLLGYTIHRSLYRTAIDRHLTEFTDDFAGRLLLIVPEFDRGMRKVHEELISRWSERSIDAVATTIDTSAGWWFLTQRPVDAERVAESVATTVEEWIAEGAN